MSELSVRLRPAVVADVDLFRRYAVEPELLGLDWHGFTDANAPARRFETDGYLGPDNGRLMVEVNSTDPATAGFVSYRAKAVGAMAQHWEIGIALLPEWRGRGIGWRAQAHLCDYLFDHSPAQRIEAGTHPENIAEQKSLVKAGFQLEGVIRAIEFRAGAWRDGYLYSRLRTDPGPDVTAPGPPGQPA